MTDSYATKVMDVMLNVLAIVQRLKSSGVARVSDVDRAMLKGLVDRIDDESARFAIVYWIDEIIVNAKAACSVTWDKETLEFERFREQNRAHLFYDRAEQASVSGNTNALSVYFLCVALGFRGVYRRRGTMIISTDTPDVVAVPAPPPPAPAPAKESKDLPFIDSDFRKLFEEHPDPMDVKDRGKGGDKSSPPGWRTRDDFGESPQPRRAEPARNVGGPPRPAPSEQFDPSRGPRSRTLPPTLEDWLRSKLPQITRSIGKYSPKSLSESSGECSPLRGRRFLSTWLRLAFVMVMLAGVETLVYLLVR